MTQDTRPASEAPRARRTAGLLTVLSRHQHVSEQRISLTTSEMRLLWLFTDGKPRTLREISESLGLEQSTVNRQVNGALTAGLLRRYDAPGRSAKLVEATPDGSRRFEQDIRDALGAVDRALDALGDDDGRFLDLLQRFVDAYGEAVHALPDRPSAAGMRD